MGSDFDPSALIEMVTAVCQSMPGAREDHPFGPAPTVYKVGGKMFALIGLSGIGPGVNLKIPPEDSEALCQIDGIESGYHMNKRHWITVYFRESTDWELLTELIEDSYALVRTNLTRKTRLALDALS